MDILKQAARIKTWNRRCEEHPSHQSGMVSHGMIQARMQEEIDDLRAALEQPEQEPVVWMQTEDFIDADGLWDRRKTFNFDGIGIPLKP